MWDGWMHGASGWEIGAIMIMLLFWVLVIAGVVFFVWFLVERAGRGARVQGAGAGETALEILQKRYARGEITHEQYQQMKRELGE
ncbi:MAG TPA: SHOCT domain-containing protein [Armatimonadota bacterium]|nr:SHOCT domain-containing protein [Armatimonadota bacterium]